MLVRYCARFTRDWLLAEDLAQQALLEAWLKADHLYAQEVRTSWLIGIACNLCLRRVRRQRQEQAIMFEGIEGSWSLSSLLEDD